MSGSGLGLRSEIYEKNNEELRENSPEEIRDVAIEMLNRLNGDWKETEEDILVQDKFWSIFKENMKKQKIELPVHGRIKGKFSSHFLKNNREWIK